MASIANLTVSLALEAAKYTEALKKSNRQTKNWQKQTTKSVNLVKKAFIAFGSGAIVDSVVDAGIQLEKFSRSLAVATGSAEGAEEALSFVRKTTDSLGTSFVEAASGFTKLSAAAQGTSLAGKDARDIFIGVSQASRVLGLSAEQSQGAFRAIEQIISKGTVQAEELRGQLGERIPGAFQIAASAMGVTTEALGDLLKQGKVVSEDFLPAFARELSERFGGAAVAASEDAQASFQRFQNEVFRVKSAIASFLLPILAEGADLFIKLSDAAKKSARGIKEAFSDSSGFSAVGEQLNDQLDKLKKDRESILNSLNFKETGEGALNFSSGFIFAGLDKRSIEQLRAELDRLNAKIAEVRGQFLNNIDVTQGFGQVEEVLGEVTVNVSKLGTQLPPVLARARDEIIQTTKTSQELFDSQASVISGLLKLGQITQEQASKALEIARQEFLSNPLELEVKIPDSVYQNLDRINERSRLLSELFNRTATPLERFRKQMLDLVEVRERLVELGADEARVNGLIARSAKQYEETYRKAAEQAEKVNKKTSELGLTFQSAFEDAIVEGKKFRDVLAGIFEDITRIIIRKNVTEPLGNIFSNIFSAFGKSGAPSSGKTSIPTLSGKSFFGQGLKESIIPTSKSSVGEVANGGLVFSPVYNIDARSADPSLRAELPVILERQNQRTKAEILELRMKGRL